MNTKIYLLAIVLLSVFSTQAQEYTFRYNLKKGDSFKNTSVADMQINQEINGRKIDMKTIMTIKLSYLVTNVQNDLITMDVKYDRMKMETEAMGQKMVFDSDASSSNPMLADSEAIFKAITGVSLSLSITPQGKLKEIKGVEKLQQAIAGTVSDPSNPMYSQISQQFSEESLKSTFEQMMVSFFPEKPVRIGESWTTDISVNQSSINLDASIKSTLLSVDNYIATLKVETQLGEKDKIYTQSINGMEVKMSMIGTQTGTMKIDVRTGWLKESDMDQDMKIESEVMGMKIPQSITGKVKLTTE